MAPSGPPMMGGLGSQAGGIQASNAPRRRSFGDYLENTMSSNQPRPPQAPQFDPRYSQAPQFAPRPDSRQARPLMNGGIVRLLTVAVLLVMRILIYFMMRVVRRIHTLMVSRLG